MNSYFYIKAYNDYRIVKISSFDNMLDVIKEQLVNNEEFKSVLDEAAEMFTDYSDASPWSSYDLKVINLLIENNYLEIISLNHIESLDSDPNYYILIDDDDNPELYLIDAKDANAAEQKFVDKKLSFFKSRVYDLNEILSNYDMWSHIAPTSSIINL